MLGYDEQKRKTVDSYVSTWSDEMQNSQGTWDEKKKILTLYSRGLDSDGKPTRYKTVTEFTDDSTQLVTISRGVLGQEAIVVKAEYKRRK